MPETKKAMTRYMILDKLLSDRYHNYSTKDLAEEVSDRLSEFDPNTNGIGVRQIQKDIHFLEYDGPFLVDIERYEAAYFDRDKKKTRTKECLRYRKPGFTIFKKDLTADEEYLLSEVLSLLGQFDGLPDFEGLEGLRLSLGLRRDNRKIVSFTKNPMENSNLFGKLFSAISHKQVIELHYHVFSKPEEIKKLNLYPYMLKEYNRRWYLIGAAESDGKVLNFGLERIDDVETLPSHKYVPYVGDIEKYFKDVIGVTVYEKKPVYTIVFWVDDKSKDYVLTKPIHGTQDTLSPEKCAALRKLYPQLKDGEFFKIECKENYELIRELTSFGEELIVLEPSDIVDAVYKRVSKMKRIYFGMRTKNSHR